MLDRNRKFKRSRIPLGVFLSLSFVAIVCSGLLYLDNASDLSQVLRKAKRISLNELATFADSRTPVIFTIKNASRIDSEKRFESDYLFEDYVIRRSQAVRSEEVNLLSPQGVTFSDGAQSTKIYIDNVIPAFLDKIETGTTGELRRRKVDSRISSQPGAIFAKYAIKQGQNILCVGTITRNADGYKLGGITNSGFFSEEPIVTAKSFSELLDMNSHREKVSSFVWRVITVILCLEFPLIFLVMLNGRRNRD